MPQSVGSHDTHHGAAQILSRRSSKWVPIWYTSDVWSCRLRIVRCERRLNDIVPPICHPSFRWCDINSSCQLRRSTQVEGVRMTPSTRSNVFVWVYKTSLIHASQLKIIPIICFTKREQKVSPSFGKRKVIRNIGEVILKRWRRF